MEPQTFESSLAAKLAAGLLLTDAEAASVMGVSRITLRNWRNRREGPRWVRVGKRAIRYKPADVQAFIDGEPDHAEAA